MKPKASSKKDFDFKRFYNNHFTLSHNFLKGAVRMKSIVRMVMLSAVMSVCLIGCGGGNDGNPANNNGGNNNSGGVSGEPLVYGGQTYRTVKIDGLTWMAENLNYEPSSGNSWCYGNDNSKCNQYGRLYDWETALTVCPTGTGWRLPDSADFRSLVNAAGGRESAGKKLKARNGWDSNGNGTDVLGFSALPGGWRLNTAAGTFEGAGSFGHWWAAEEGVGIYGGPVGSCLYMHSERDYAAVSTTNTVYGFSVRCVKTE
jgi:uncharacterized protein (TIGR02145 family)